MVGKQRGQGYSSVVFVVSNPVSYRNIPCIALTHFVLHASSTGLRVKCIIQPKLVSLDLEFNVQIYTDLHVLFLAYFSR